MHTSETVAQNAIKEALQALERARELSEQAGYGSLVLGSLVEAQRSAQYAYDTAMGRN